jgi:integrase
MKGTIKIATINKKLAAVRSLLSHCVVEGYLDYSVASNIGKVKKDKENKASQSQSHTERVIGSDEVWELIAAASTERDRLALKTCYLLGLRVHELSNLHWLDFSRDGKRYKVRIIGKNSKEAYLPVDRELMNEFRQLETTGYIFQSRLGRKRSPVQLHRITKRAAGNAGLDEKISMHWLRHQRCSDLVNSGKFTLSQVQRFMRHSSPTITDSYIHLEDEISSNELI